MLTKRLLQSERRQQILEDAIALSITRGYRGYSLSDLASACSVGKSRLLQLFGSKEGLLNSVMRQAIADSVLPIIAQGLAAKDPLALAAPYHLKMQAAATLC